jgi:hypothetical protein
MPASRVSTGPCDAVDPRAGRVDAPTAPVLPTRNFADLVDWLSVLAARLSTEEFRRLICAMAQARQKR